MSKLYWFIDDLFYRMNRRFWHRASEIIAKGACFSSLTAFFIGLFVFSHLGGADDEQTSNKLLMTSPLGVFISSSPEQQVVVENPTQYLSEMDKTVQESILSEEEVWYSSQNRQKQSEVYTYFQRFYTWYITQLPLLIFADKKGFKGSDRMISEFQQGSLSEISFLFSANTNITADIIISFTNRYGYTFHEKINLFLVVLYKNISAMELLKLQKAWGITGNIAIYTQNYQKYIEEFFQSFSLDQERAIVISLFKMRIAPFTSILHEFFSADRHLLFNKMLGRSKENVNVQDYLLQTVAHKVANEDWKRAQDYLPSLLKHPLVDWNIQDYQGWTALFYIVDQSRDKVSPALRQIMSHKSKIDMGLIDHNLRTLPLVAAEGGHPELAQFLHAEGAPLPRRVSLFNSYITSDYKAVWFRHRTQFHLRELENVFNFPALSPSFEDFQRYLAKEESAILSEEFLHNFRYYFLLHFLEKSLSIEENLRYSIIMPWLFNDKHEVMKNGFDTRLIRAMRQDIGLFRSIVSNIGDKNMLTDNLFWTRYIFKNTMEKWVISNFDLLDRIKVKPLSQSDGALLFYIGVSSLLSEAVRANQAPAVEFLLGEGADPTVEEKNFVVRNSIVTAILMGDLLYRYSDPYKEHLRIVDMLMDHPSVTKDFLNRDVIPGINYADLTGLRGHLDILKRIYKTGARVTENKVIWDTGIWDTGFLVESFTAGYRFGRITEFILEEKIERNPEDQGLRKSLRSCRDAFH